MDSFTTFDLLKIVAPVAGVAAGAVKYAVKRELNGSAQRIKDIAEAVKELKTGQDNLSSRMVRLETIVEERTG